MPSVLYVMGMGRSGSTILDVLLGNNPITFSAGELTHVFRDVLERDVACACGLAASACPIWSRVMAQCGWTRADAERLDGVFRSIDWHTRFPVVALGWVGRRKKADYAEVNSRLFGALAAISGKSVIVDSSKYPGRALALARAFPQQVRILCIIRSPHSLLAAFSKPHRIEQRPKRPLAAAAYYIYLLVCIRIVKFLLPDHVLFVRYEDLLKSPSLELQRVSDWSGVDTSAARAIVDTDGQLNVGHIVTGNRLRKEKQVRFRRSTDDSRLESREARIAAGVMDAVRRLFGLN